MIVWRSSALCLLFSVIFLCNSYLQAKPAGAPETPQYKIFTLTNISADQGAKFLAEVKIGTVSKFPGGSNALLITADPSELIKATSILTLVDAKEQFAVKMISPTAGLNNLPSNEQIASKVGNISVGTFSSPPINTAAVRAIVDIHNNSVVVVAPVSQIERIISAIDGRPISPPSRPQLAEAGAVAHRDEQEARPPSVSGASKMVTPPSFAGSEKPSETQGQPAESTIPSQPSTEQTAVEPRQPSEALVIESSATRRYTPAPIPDGNETLKLNLPETLAIVDLLGLVGEYLGLDFMYDPAQIQGEVTLKLQGKLRGDLRVKDLYPLLESVLRFRGFAMTRKGNLVTITPVDQALDIDPVLMSDDKGKVEHGDVVVTRVFQLQYIDTVSAQNFLTAMRLATTVVPITETGTLVVTGYAYRMPRIEGLLEIIDRPGEPREFRSRQLKFTMAKTLTSKVKTLSEELGTVSITVTTPTQPTPTPERRPRRPGGPTQPPTTPTPTPTPTKITVYLDADERTNRILMIGIAKQLDIVDALIDSLDVEQQDLRSMKLYKMEHVDAAEAKKKLQELGIISGGVQTTPTTRPSRITAPATRPETPPSAQPPPATTPTGTTIEGPLEEPQVVVIEMTNSLLINATPEQHAQIQQILTYVDSKTEEEEIPYKIYPLENQNPEDLATVLNQLIKETVKDKEGKIQQVVAKTEEDITIIPDKSTFSIIVYASKKNQEWISTLIKQLDKRRPQVLIDVSLVEITRTDIFDLDLQLASKFPSLEPNGIMDVVSAITPHFLPKTSLEAYSAPKSNVAKGFYSDSHIQALLTAMQTKKYGRVLAKPKILVNDGQAGTIKTTETTNVPIQQTVVPTGTTGTSTTVPTYVTTTNFQACNAGITLTITPNISEGNLLLLDVQLDRTDFGTVPAPGSPPNTTASNIKTTVTVPNNKTIILGGLLRLNQTKGGTKVPLLGDVPIVGGLFRSTHNETPRDSQLYIFVKANILRPDETLAELPELEKISDENRIAFEKAEGEFQKYADWPGMKPKPFSPTKALEAQ